ncbi:MAG: cytochrome c [Candidatus Binatia bacterium]
MSWRRRVMTIVLSVVAGSAMVGCERLPGKPTDQERWVPPSAVKDFASLYGQNCSGCHGADGRLGPARPLNDPLYLALVTDDALYAAIANGTGDASMPAFAQQAGGSLTDTQIAVLVTQMRARWGRPDQFVNAVLPPYSVQDALAKGSAPGAPQRGRVVYETFCLHCHGEDGQGGTQGSAIVDPAYLALVSDQTLRTTVIVGRADLHKPDWRANLANQPMRPQDISDVVAWLASQRPAGVMSP